MCSSSMGSCESTRVSVLLSYLPVAAAHQLHQSASERLQRVGTKAAVQPPHHRCSEAQWGRRGPEALAESPAEALARGLEGHEEGRQQALVWDAEGREHVQHSALLLQGEAHALTRHSLHGTAQPRITRFRARGRWSAPVESATTVQHFRL